MAALDFPSSPTSGQQYAAPNGVTYQWDGAAWVTTGGPANVWTDTGTALTPTTASRMVTVPGDPVAGNALILGQSSVGSRARLIPHPTSPSIYMTQNLYLDNTVSWVQDDATKASWNVLFGASSDNYTLRRSAAGSVSQVNLFVIDSSANLTIAGSIGQKASGTTWANPSDPRLKQDVVAYEKSLAEVCRLEPIAYHLKSDPDGPLCYGFDAEKVRDVFPECVGTTRVKLTEDGEEEEVLTFDIHPVLVALVNAVKELSARVAALEAHA